MAFKLASKAKSIPLAEPVFPSPRLPSPPLELETSNTQPAAARISSSKTKKSDKDASARPAKGSGGSRWEKIPGQDVSDRSKEQAGPAVEKPVKEKKSEKDRAVKPSKDKDSKPAKDRESKEAKSTRPGKEKEGKDSKRGDDEEAGKDKDRKADKDKDKDRGREQTSKRDKKEDAPSKSKRKRSRTR